MDVAVTQVTEDEYELTTAAWLQILARLALQTEAKSNEETRGVVVAGALGPIRGKAFRIGHMGNIGEQEVLWTLRALESSLASLGAERPEPLGS